MSQNIETNRKQWPREHDDFKVGSKEVDPKKVWEPKSTYDQGGKYHKVRATTFRSGQSFEIDETPGAERIRLINSDGSYAEWQHDGTWILRSQGSSYEVVVGNKNVRVKGFMDVHVSGATNVKVEGNVDLEVGGALTQTVAGLTTLNYDGGTQVNTPFLKISGNEVSHDGINIGKSHKHTEVMPGPGISGIPLPI